MMDKIDSVRKKLDSMLGNDLLGSEEVLRVSEELDVLILEYYKDMEKEMALESE